MREDGDIRITGGSYALAGLGEGQLVIGSCGTAHGMLRQIVLLYLIVLPDRPAINLVLARATTSGVFFSAAHARSDVEPNPPVSLGHLSVLGMAVTSDHGPVVLIRAER